MVKFRKVQRKTDFRQILFWFFRVLRVIDGEESEKVGPKFQKWRHHVISENIFHKMFMDYPVIKKA